MKVICTDDRQQTCKNPVEIGSSYTVVGFTEEGRCGGCIPGIYFYLSERPGKIGYWSGLFSSIQQTEQHETVKEAVPLDTESKPA
jgi:hypothetical protein